MLVLVSLISLLIAIPGLINKSGEKFYKGLIPIYNIGLFFEKLCFPPIILALIGIGMAFTPYKMLFLTLLLVLMPFIVSDSYGMGIVVGVLTLFLPFIMYPFIGYIGGHYINDSRYNKKGFFRREVVLVIILCCFSYYLFDNYTRLVTPNKLLDKDSIQYVNDVYMSDGRIYSNYLNEYEKKMYDLILSSSKKYVYSINIDFNEFGCKSYEEAGALVDVVSDAILVDHPELIGYSNYSWVYKNGVFTLHIIYAKNNPLFIKLGEMRIQREIEKIKIKTKDMTDKEKIKYVYEWMGDNNTYDQLFTYTSKNQSIYNVFLKHNAVCAGFAKASNVIFQNIGIKSYGILGESTGPHMWNVVELDGKYYYFDSTVATSIRKKESEYYYYGLLQSEMDYYTVDHMEWYPEIEKENGLFSF